LFKGKQLLDAFAGFCDVIYKDNFDDIVGLFRIAHRKIGAGVPDISQG
jgi:hypothetical protein